MRQKIIVFMAIIGVLIISIMTAIMAGFNEKQIINDTLKNTEDIAHVITVTIDNYLNDIVQTTKTLASSLVIKDALLEDNNILESLNNDERITLIEGLNSKWIESDNINDSFIQNYLSNPVATHLKYQKKVIPDLYGEIFLTNKYGSLVASTGKLSTLAHSNKYWWIASYNDDIGRVFLDDRGFDTSVDGYVLGVVVPVYDDNSNVIGILKSNINIISLFNEIIEEYKSLVEIASIKIVRTNGLIVFEPNIVPLSASLDEKFISKLKSGTVSETVRDKNNDKILINILSIHNTEGSSEIGFGGKSESIDHIQGNTGESWALVLTTPKSYINDQVNASTRQYVLIGILLLLIEIVAIYVFAKEITRPIVELVEITKDLNKGNLDKEITINAKDEIGELVNSFKNMVSRIKNTMASRDELIIEIEKREQLEKTQLEMEAKLQNQQKLESIGILASGVAHEINNPLNGILNYSQLISDVIKNRNEDCENSRGDVDEYSSEIIKETQRISKIVSNLLQFSRIEGKSFSKIKIEDILEDTLLLINTILKHDQISLEVEIPKELPEIECRPNQIQQVLMNLIVNAKYALNVKYPEYDENKKIVLKVDCLKYNNQEGVRITVKDNGNGIPADIQNNIFDPFFTTKGRTEGTGLGLSISYGIVNEHGGELSFETVEDEFTKFIIDLPLKQKPKSK